MLYFKASLFHDLEQAHDDRSRSYIQVNIIVFTNKTVNIKIIGPNIFFPLESSEENSLTEFQSVKKSTFFYIKRKKMGLVEALVIATIISGSFYVMNQDKAIKNGTKPKLLSSSISLFVLVTAVIFITSFFIQSSPEPVIQNKGVSMKGGNGLIETNTPVSEALRYVDVNEPFF